MLVLIGTIKHVQYAMIVEKWDSHPELQIVVLSVMAETYTINNHIGSRPLI